jgi:hypothetical protein
MTKKRESIAVIAMSAIGAAGALGAANEADALYRMWINTTDVLSNMATKPSSTTGGFSISGVNAYGTTWAYGSRSGNTITANISSQGGSMYARAYARCYTPTLGVYSAVYSDSSFDSTARSISCSSLPAGAGPWSLQGWGVSVLSTNASGIAASARSLCDGQGCGAPNTLSVSNTFLRNYPALALGKTGIGGAPSVSVPGPEAVPVPGCW